MLLSAAIGLTIASFLELVIYQQELTTLIHRLHYEDNKVIYDEINAKQAGLDKEISNARIERDRVTVAKNQLAAELLKLELSPPPLPSERNTATLDSQIAELRGRILQEEASIRKYARDMVGEFRGTMVTSENSGLPSIGQRYRTAQDLKGISEATIADLKRKISDLETDKVRLFSNREAEKKTASAEVDERKNSIRGRFKAVADELAVAQSNLVSLETARGPGLQSFVDDLKKKPDFVAISFGVASQFRALRTLYREYGSTFEMYMIKMLIMMLEMMPVLQKWFLSPTTLYAVKLDAAKRTRAYADFDEELRSRQEHLRHKAHAAIDEELDGKGIERFRERKVTSLHEAKGVA